jgi:hypothetical protein
MNASNLLDAPPGAMTRLALNEELEVGCRGSQAKVISPNSSVYRCTILVARSRPSIA